MYNPYISFRNGSSLIRLKLAKDAWARDHRVILFFPSLSFLGFLLIPSLSSTVTLLRSIRIIHTLLISFVLPLFFKIGHAFSRLPPDHAAGHKGRDQDA